MIEFLAFSALAAMVAVLATFGLVKDSNPVTVPSPVRIRRDNRR